MDKENTNLHGKVNKVTDEIEDLYETEDAKEFIDYESKEIHEIIFRTHNTTSIEILKLKFTERGSSFLLDVESTYGLREKGYTEKQLVLELIESGKRMKGARRIKLPFLFLDKN